MILFSAADVLSIHKKVINKNELQGLAANKSIEAIVARVENRIHYGLIGDTYDLASSYTVVIAVGHAFNDANKRTAFTSMDVCLKQNGIVVSYDMEFIGQLIIKAAQGQVDEVELARYLHTM